MKQSENGTEAIGFMAPISSHDHLSIDPPQLGWQESSPLLHADLGKKFTAFLGDCADREGCELDEAELRTEMGDLTAQEAFVQVCSDDPPAWLAAVILQVRK